jgi:hypothetical protein
VDKIVDDANLSDLRREVVALRERLEKMEAQQRHPMRRIRWRRLKPGLAILLVSAGCFLFMGVLGAESSQEDALFIGQTGNVGIDTKTPGFPLTFPNQLGDKISLWGQSGEHFGFGIQNGLLQISTNGGGSDVVFGHGSSSSMTEVMRIKGTGNVGIGTKTPGFPLTFPNQLGDKISLWGQSGEHFGFGIQTGLLQIHSDASAADIAFGHGSSSSMTEVMRIKGNGNVGIGTTQPKALLDVKGQLRGSPWFSQEYTWDQGEPSKNNRAIEMTRVDRSVCFITYVRGLFEGWGEFVEIRQEGNHWMLGGSSGQKDVRVKARCIGAPDDSWK